MRITLRKLKVVAALSEETTCYTAEIWIDGARAFLASNHGQGGMDDFRQVGVHTEQAVNAWLAAHRPPVRIGDVTLDHTLELEVAAMIGRIEETRRLRRVCRTQLVVIDNGKVFGYPLQNREPTVLAEIVRRQRPGMRVVNGDDRALENAVDLMVARG